MEKGFRKIFWGFIFLLFHINLGTFQIIPDCISYYIILNGVDFLFENCNNKSLSICTDILWLQIIAGFIEDCSRTLGTPIFAGSSYGFLYTAVMCTINIVMVYFLLQGIIEILLEYCYEDEAKSFGEKQKYYIIADTVISMMVVSLSAFGYNNWLSILAVIGAVAIKIWLIININYLRKINFTKTNLEI